MIATKAKESIDQAVCYELQNIVKEYGPTYHSTHEGYAVLKEEVEEAAEDMKKLEEMLEHLWETIKINFSVDDELTRFLTATWEADLVVLQLIIWDMIFGDVR